jgi:hypothetical protein
MKYRLLPKSLFWPGWLVLVGLATLGGGPPARAQFAQAPVEVRVPVAPQLVVGSDGLRHLAYELHVTNFYQSTGTLLVARVSVFADDQAQPLANFTAPQINHLLAHPAAGDTARVRLAAGQRRVLFVWLTLPAGAPSPRVLRHQLEFVAGSGARQLVDGVRLAIDRTPPLSLAPPLRAGPWLAHEGPGSYHSHHWGSLVAANGQVTIPQRYAIDFFGLDATRHAVRVARDKLAESTTSDWVGFGADVLAVADGVVRDLRDDEPDHAPFAPLAPPTDLTVRTLLGNFVVLEIAPRVFVHYGHLQLGSVAVKVGDRVRRGAILGRLGQSGNSNAPHLHFQVTTAATFEESEGLPFVFTTFRRLGSAALGEALDTAARVSLGATPPKQCVQQMPLSEDVIEFK